MFGKKRKYNVQDNENYPLKGLLKCNDCHHALTSSNPRGSTKSYRHYECGKDGCRKIRINIDKIHKQFEDLLMTVKLSKGVLSLFQHMVFSEWDKSINTAVERSERIQNLITKLENELRDITKANNKGIYSDDFAKSEADRINKEIVTRKIELGDVQIQRYDAEKVKNFTEHFLLNLDS